MLMDQIFPFDLSIVKLLVTIIGLSTFCLDLEKLNGNVAIKEECTKTLHVHVWHKDSHIDGTRSSSRQTEGEQSLSTFQMRRKWLNQRITADGSRLANIIMVFD
jgi:hypothetical protein